MVELNLEEIKQKTNVNLTRFFQLHNVYKWKEISDITENKDYTNIPLFEVSKKELSDSTKFSILGDDGTTGWVCFGAFLFHYPRRSRTSRILFDITPRKVLKGTENNHCWFNIEQLNYWIYTMKQETGLDFFYKITEGENNYHIIFDFKKLCFQQIKYILFWTRYTFEYPASFSALDAILLKRDYFPEEPLTNLLTLAAVCQSANTTHITEYQNITIKGKFLQLEEFQRRIQQRNCRSVSSIFESSCKPPSSYTERNRVTHVFNYDIPDWYKARNMNGKDWIEYTDRFKIYQDVYPLLKEHEIKLKEEEA